MAGSGMDVVDDSAEGGVASPEEGFAGTDSAEAGTGVGSSRRRPLV